MTIRCDLHVHTHHSFDCFSSIEDIAKQAKQNGINIVAITDHDVIGLTQKEKKILSRLGIDYIQGCEFTTDKGAHIIGLFIDNAAVSDKKDAICIVNKICESGGIVLVPHPFRRKSGLMNVYDSEPDVLSSVLSKSTLIELQNGKYGPDDESDKIHRLAKLYNLKLVATSDSHKPWELGRCMAIYNEKDMTNIREILKLGPVELKSNDTNDRTEKQNILCKLLKLRSKLNIYNFANKSVPFSIKRNIKKTFYLFEKYFRTVTGNWKIS